MLDSITKLIIGDMDDKREYRQTMKRVKALPEEYRFVFHKIQNYINSGAHGESIDINKGKDIFTALLDLFEEGAAEKKPVLDITGRDVGAFSDNLIRAAAGDRNAAALKLNREIQSYFTGGGEHNA